MVCQIRDWIVKVVLSIILFFLFNTEEGRYKLFRYLRHKLTRLVFSLNDEIESASGGCKEILKADYDGVIQYRNRLANSNHDDLALMKECMLFIASLSCRHRCVFKKK